jgi:hypothetical protein
VPASDHIDLNDFENGWYIDPAELCSHNSAGSNSKVQSSKTKIAAGCTKNADGSYNLKLVAEFTPQRWFYVGSIISATTLLACIGYLTYNWRKDKKPKSYHARR